MFGLIWSNLNAGSYAGPAATADSIARWASAVFSADKFWTLFSLLFGVTLAMQLERADAGSRPIVGRWLRRMTVLFGIGWAHAILFWPGDILRGYAIAGAMLVLFRRASNRSLLVVAIVALAFAANRESLSVVATRIAQGNVEAVRQREQPSPDQQNRRRAFGNAMQNGSYRDVVQARLRTFPREQIRVASPPAGPLNWIDPWVLGLFLLGLVLGRYHVVQRPERHRHTVLAFIITGVVIGLPLNMYLAARPAWLANHWLYQPLRIAASLTLSLGYLTGLLWLLQRPRWRDRLRFLGPVGRLGLTSYIAQTAFLTFVQLHYGLGLAPVLGSFACFVIAFAFYGIQVAWSNWWVRRFSFGPVEWLWRRLTYGAVHPVQPSPLKAG